MNKQEVIDKIKNPPFWWNIVPGLIVFLRELVMEFVERDPERIEVIIEHGDQVPIVKVYDEDAQPIDTTATRLGSNTMRIMVKR